MRIVSPNAEISLAEVRHLSESAVNNPPRKNIIVPYVPMVTKPATGRELPDLPAARREHASARINFFETEA